MTTQPLDPNQPAVPLQVPAPSTPQQPASVGSPQPVAPSSKKKWWIVLLIVAGVILLCSCTVIGITFFSAIGSDNTNGFAGSGDGDVAIIHIDDEIQGSGSGITPEGFNSYLQKALDDDSIKAIVLRIDSPGGTVAASEEISRYVNHAKKDKPIVVSVGDMCASGAYMVASQADEIVAMQGSAIGSIGVIMEIPDISELLDKVGVTFQTLTAGENKDEGSMYRSLTKDEIKNLQGDLDEIHKQFIARVASGRDLTPEKVRELATGETYLGEDAKSLGLIDGIGTLDQACDIAAGKAHLDLDAYDTIVLDGYDDPFTSLLDSYLGLRAGKVIEGLIDNVAGSNSGTTALPQTK